MNNRSNGREPVILFDGACMLCNRTARFVLRHDQRARFRFATLQSPVARHLLHREGNATMDPDSVVLLAGGRAYRRSRAILEIVRRLDGPWPLLYGLVVVPRFLADLAYDFIGARRYRWFGTTTSCALLEVDRARILDEREPLDR